MNDPTDIYRQELEQEAAEQARQLQALGTKADLMWLMSDKRGRNIVAMLLDFTGVMAQSFAVDRCVTDFNEGQRAVGIKMLNQLKLHTPHEFVLMLSEQLLPTKE